MLLVIILGIAIVLLMLHYVYKNISTLVEYIIFWILVFVIFPPVIIYYLDTYNIPTLIGVVHNINTDKWFDFTVTYICAISGTIISSLIVIATVVKQIKVQNDNSKEEKRIENAPLIKYYIKNEYVKTDNQSYIFNFDGHTDGHIYNIFFGIENIGLNHAKHIKIEMTCKEEEWTRSFIVKDEQSILKKEEIYWFDFVVNKPQKSKDKKTIIINVVYCDMLNNEYNQKISIKYTVTNQMKVESRGLKVYFDNINIEDEIYKKQVK